MRQYYRHIHTPNSTGKVIKNILGYFWWLSKANKALDLVIPNEGLVKNEWKIYQNRPKLFLKDILNREQKTSLWKTA